MSAIMSAIAGYVLGTSDNGGSLYYAKDKGIIRCPTCNFVVNRDYIPPRFKVRKNTRDFSATYDHVLIASERFREFCDRHRLKKLEFVTLPNNIDYYIIRSRAVVTVDIERTKPDIEDLCPTCNRYACIAVPNPIVLKGVSAPLPTGIYATDITVGSWDEREQMLIASPDVKDLLKHEKLRGFHFAPVFG